ncbi:hypothetical protein PtA15_4A879 [Puccinia triticina]|uniref:WD40 repeat-like protein n=1 Tax=Puccinia triticina TaxID=208348 RepID=A0ABY7CGS4_9BASI|nr:uncharacterized protein PtA15_4A879 [Puccinia triticina]WAQ84426.1 hypothetical protein PtA15_4A879 [Puccinia triticina]
MRFSISRASGGLGAGRARFQAEKPCARGGIPGEAGDPTPSFTTFHQKPAFTKTTTHHHTTQPKHPTHALPITTLAIDHTTPIRNPLNPQGILYAAGRDGLISAWELNQHKQASFRQAIQPHTHWINDLILCNQNQTIISASSDRTIKAWNPHSPQHALCPATIGTHLDYVKCLAHSPKAAWVASAGLDRTILLWDTNEARPNPLGEFSENLVGTSIYSLATTPAGQLLAAGSPAQAIALYDPRLATQLAKLVGHTDNVRAILLADDATRLLSASSDATVKMWDLRSQQRCLHTFAHHSTSVWALHSQHPALEIFYSADRAGWLCKLDLEGSDDFRDGQCIVLAHARQSRSHHQQGINSILAFDNFVWTASASSSIERWADIPTRIQRPLVPLFSQFDHLLPNADHQDPESITIHSPKSDASIPRRPSHHHIHSTMSSLSLRPPTHPGLEPVKLHSPLTIDATIPLRSSPVDLILGCSGLIKSELLNDCRHALTIDTSGRIALWDIISCTCQGIFDPDELERELDHGSSAGSSGSNYTPSELLKLVKERIEGQATIGTWCTVETQTGLLTVHLDEQRCFDGEVYADEAGLAEEVLELMKEDHRLCLGRWVLRNLFDGFINHHVQLRLRNENPTTPSAATDAANPGQTAESDEQQQNKKIYLPGRPFVPHTPGMTIALATPALTPAILPDLKTLTGPKNQQAADHSADYFSLPRLMEADEEQLGSEALTPGGGGGAGGGGGGGGLDSSTDASSSYTSSVYPLPSPRRASPVPVTTTQDGLPRDDKTPMTESPAASWSSTTSSAAAPPPPNSANIFSRFRSLGRGQKRRGSSDPAAPPVISNPIPYREDGDQAELDGQRLLMLEKAKAQQALVVQAVLAQPFEPCGPLDAPALMLPPDTTILVSEEEPQSGGWEVAYRGLVATTELDAEVLMDVLPGWILGFLLANRISNKEGGASTTTTTTTVKVTFVLQPEGGREAAGLPELPNGNARLTASRVLRMKKVAAYVAQKLDPAGSEQGTLTPTSTSGPNPRLPAVDESLIVLSCNGQDLPRTLSLGVVKQWVWAQPGDVVICYRRQGLAPSA